MKMWLDKRRLKLWEEITELKGEESPESVPLGVPAALRGTAMGLQSDSR